MYQSLVYALTRTESLYFDVVKKYLFPSVKDRILEIGCNMGRLVRKFQGIAPNTYGIDINEKAIEAGATSNLQVMDVRKLEFPDASFDKVYSTHTIEHIPELTKALKEMARILKKGGRAVLIYPAEPIRGLFCLPSSLLLLQNPRKIHVHKLSPQLLINEFVPETGFTHIKSEFSFFPGPQYVTILEKI